jgi:hypothetical protein
MPVEPMSLGALASMLSAVGYAGWRAHRSGSRTPGAGPFRLAQTYARGHADAARERERRATIVAAVAALPPSATLVDRRADGATLTIRMPPPAAGTQPVTMEPRRAAR